MLKTIYKSQFTKLFCLLLTVSMLTMSFTPKNDANVVIPSGTIIPLENNSEITSATMVPGQTINFFVRSDVKINGQTVIKSGAVAKGLVTRAEKAKGLGKEGFLEVEIKSVEAVDGTQILLAGTRINQVGEDRQTAAILLGVLVCILFLTKKGKDAAIPAGYSFEGRVAQEVTVAVN